jgi:hypothetical protein
MGSDTVIQNPTFSQNLKVIIMEAKSEGNKSLQGLENQKINSETVLGGTKQAWTNENSKPQVDNAIPEGRRGGFLKKGRQGGPNFTGPSEK